MQNRVAVVTGGSRGIGAAICRNLARDGADIAIWDWNTDRAREVADEIVAMGRRALVCKVDVSRRDDIAAACTVVRKELGQVGILVNNAGLAPEKNFIDISEKEWDEVFAVNMKGSFLCTQALVEDMMKAQWGRIINISSSSAQSGAKRMVHYAATKGGIIAFTKALALELAPMGITVNNVPPSSVHTEGLKEVADRLDGGLQAYADNYIPVKRLGQPEDIANAVAFLAAEASGFITGVTLSVNGGRYML